MHWKRWIVVASVACGGCSKLNASFATDGEGETEAATVGTSVGTSQGSDTARTSGTTDVDPTKPESTTGTTTQDPSGPDTTRTDTNETNPSTSTTALGSSEVGETGANVCELPDETCELLPDNCGEGFRCLPYDSTGNFLPDDFGCFEAPRVLSLSDCLGDCGPFGGFDACALDQLCEPLPFGESECVQMCRAQTGCSVGQCETDLLPGNSIGLCRTPCDPVEQDCPDNQMCIVDGDGLSCVAEGQQEEGAPCAFLDDCMEGLFCTPESAQPDCEEAPCCAPLCDVSSETCPGETECISLFPGSLVNTDVGVCRVP